MDDKKTKGKGGRPKTRPPGSKYRAGWWTDEEWAAVQALVKLMRMANEKKPKPGDNDE